MKTQLYSLWELLEENEVFIPIIQRDYAQGRKGKEVLRKHFFTNLIEALNNKSDLKLDFVYGTIEDGKFAPLDGQQRLTSLWLLHWYLAYKTEHLAEDSVKTRLKKFSYETRISSREFIQKLCNGLNGDENEKEGKSISDIIRNQPWFTQSFASDPTIQSMLTSLDDKEKGCGFEQLLKKEKYKDKWDAYWELLCSEKCPITFFYKDMKDDDLPESDSLYVKMNARGKRLTNFENFKAELFKVKHNDKELFSLEEFISPFENQWTNNIFWPYKNEEKKIDEIFFKFINRICRNNLLRRKKFKEDLKDKSTLWLQFEREENLKDEYVFESIEAYEEVLTEDSDKVSTENFVKNFTNMMNNISTAAESLSEHKFNNILKAPYEFKFIPEYNKGGISSITIPERVLMEGVACYFIYNEYNEETFRDWMFFVRNLTYNSSADRYERIGGLLEKIYEWAKHSGDVITFLKDYKEEYKDIAAEQFKEEVEKAKMISTLRAGERSFNFTEKDIRDAETDLPTDGAIRYLFTNPDPDKSIDWNQFKQKSMNAKKLFLKKDTDTIPVNTLRKLVALFDKGEQFSCNQQLIYDSKKSSWKNILLNLEELKEPVHKLLTSTEELLSDDKLSQFEPQSALNDAYKQLQKDLVTTNFLEKTTWCEFAFREGNMLFIPNGAWADWKSYYLGTPRNRLLSKAIDDGLVSLEESKRLYASNFFYGAELNFQYRDRRFKWYRTEYSRETNEVDIYLINEDNKEDYLKRTEPIEENERDSHYSARIKKQDISQDEFYEVLDNLIEEAKSEGMIE